MLIYSLDQFLDINILVSLNRKYSNTSDTHGFQSANELYKNFLRNLLQTDSFAIL